MSKEANGKDFKSYKGVIHLKHTGTELITDVISLSEEGNFVTVKNPCYLQSMATESGKSQMALVPFLMTTKEDSVHLPLGDILFISECRQDVAEQHTQMFSSVILPQTGSKSKIIM